MQDHDNMPEGATARPERTRPAGIIFAGEGLRPADEARSEHPPGPPPLLSAPSRPSPPDAGVTAGSSSGSSSSGGCNRRSASRLRAPRGLRAPTTLGRMRNDERGLTTLEWLLIVAAVAGIAALAVVLVQNVVSDVSEQIAGSNARVVAAQLAGEQIERDSKRPSDDQPPTIDDKDDWERFYESRCERLRITYGDAGVNVYANFSWGHTATADVYGGLMGDAKLKLAKTASDITTGDNTARKKIKGETPAGTSEIFAVCLVTTEVLVTT